jgi:hypothetical protein
VTGDEFLIELLIIYQNTTKFFENILDMCFIEIGYPIKKSKQG